MSQPKKSSLDLSRRGTRQVRPSSLRVTRRGHLERSSVVVAVGPLDKFVLQASGWLDESGTLAQSTESVLNRDVAHSSARRNWIFFLADLQLFAASKWGSQSG